MNARAVPAAAPDRREPPVRTARAESEVAPKPRRRHVSLYLAPGQRLADRYEVVQLIGEGGMGVVYSCRDLNGELCAVKRVVLPESNPDEHLRWFVAEAQALAALNHANVVRARDFGQLRDGTPYLVMDLVEGVLWQELSAEPRYFPLFWTLVDQVLAALAHAHARGIVHGDLKPSNVIVDLDDRRMPRARLFDFGLAKRRRCLLDPRLGQHPSPSEPPASAGTPGYMAPEQILGRTSEISGAADLYALGCMLYRVLAGRPLAGPEGGRNLDFHAFVAPSRPPALPGVSEALVDFVLSLLVAEPWRRLSSAAEVRSGWQRFRPDAGSSVEAPASLFSPLREGVADIERTRQVGPGSAQATSAKLDRSNRWLPGLLSVRSSPLVGRADHQRALSLLFERVKRAGNARQRAVLLTGPAGVGKSRLAEWLCAELEERGEAVVLRGFRPAPNVPRDPLALALTERFGIGRGALRLLPSDLVGSCPESDLGSVVDWLLQGPSRAGSRSLVEQPLAPQLVRVLAAVARGRPLVLWLDDIAALAPESWAALLQTPELDPTFSLLVVATARAETLAKPLVARGVRALKRALPTEFLRVKPLDALATSALLCAAYPLDPALALQIALDSGGVPLEALSRLYAAARRGRL